MAAVVMGRTIGDDTYQHADFFSTTSFLDFDLVVLDLENILIRFLGNAGKYGNTGALAPDSGTFLQEALKRRSAEFVEYLQHGRSAVILATQLGLIRWFLGNGYAEIRVSNYFWGCGPKTIAQSGSAVEYCGPTWAKEFAELLSPHLRYSCVLNEVENMIPMFVIKGTKKPVGGYLDLKDSWVLILPSFPSTSSDADRAFGSAVELFVAAHRKGKEPAQLPDWHVHFLLPGEGELRGRAAELQGQLVQHQEKIKHNLAEIQELEHLKGLFTEKGQRLVDLVKVALVKLGFRVTPGPEGQDDLVAQYNEKYAVLEVKGRDQSSAVEKDAAQLEKWSSRFYEERGKEPKSILVVNAFRDVPLDHRTGVVFPSQMLKYSTRKEQCLISGVQLLCLVHSAKSEAERAAAAESLLDSIGVYPKFGDGNWIEVIAHVANKNG